MAGSRIYAIRVTGGQERNVAKAIEVKARLKRLPIKSVLAFDEQKGYVYVEAENPQAIMEAISGYKHAKSLVPGNLRIEDIGHFLIPRSPLADLDLDDVVEVVSGPFRGMRARVTRIDRGKSEVTIILLDAPYRLPVTVDANYIKLVSKASEGGE